MPEIISNTSPLQYLHQVKRLELLPALVRRVIIPPAVVHELTIGRGLGIDLPDPAILPWIEIRHPATAMALPLVTDLGRGEAEVLALGLEIADSIVIIDDGLARQVADVLHIRRTGTLGLLLDAKKKRLIAAIAPILDDLQTLRFRISPATRATILRLGGE